MEHGISGRFMSWRIEVVETVGQYCHGVKSILQSTAVRVDIHAVCHTADDQHLRTELSEIFDKPLDEILTIGCAFSGAHDTDDTFGVERRIPFIKE